MPNMRRLVGINAGMFNQNFSRRNRRHRLEVVSNRRCQLSSIHPNIDIAAARYFEFFEARKSADARYNLLRNLARSLAKLPRQLKSKRQSVLAKLNLRRLLHNNICVFQPISASQKLAQMLDQTQFQISIQDCPLNY